MTFIYTYTRVHARHNLDMLATHTRDVLQRKSTKDDDIGLGLVIVNH